MDISITEAKKRFTELISAVEDGQSIVITRHGKPVAQLGPAPRARHRVRLGEMKDRIRLLRGWGAPVDLDVFL
jgi:prevent-host-death family protein